MNRAFKPMNMKKNPEDRNKQELIMKLTHEEVFVNQKFRWQRYSAQKYTSTKNINTKRTQSLPTLAMVNRPSISAGTISEWKQQAEEHQSYRRDSFRAKNAEILQRYHLEKHGTADVEFYTICNVNKCESTADVIKALQYYATFTINNKDDIANFVQICQVKYSFLLDDYIHIITVHNSETDLESIFQLMIKKYQLQQCNINNCILSLRHHRDRHHNKITNKKRGAKHEKKRNKTIRRLSHYFINKEESKEYDEIDHEFLFYQDLMDQMHCYLFHLYDTGMRVKWKEINKNVCHEDEKAMSDTYVDNAFLSMHNIIKTKMKNLGYGQLSSKKFMVEVATDNTEDTFVDGAVQCIQSCGEFTLRQIQLFARFLNDEEYDSDAILLDVNLNYSTEFIDSNIMRHSKHIYNSVKDYAYFSQLRSHTFHIGYRIYYWDHYRHKVLQNNQSYDLRRLYVAKKYSNLKAEILNNRIFILSVTELQVSIHKTGKYIHSKKAKRMKATPDYGGQMISHDRNDDLHYEIKAGKRATVQHLLSRCIFAVTNRNIKIKVKAVDRYQYDVWKEKRATKSWLYYYYKEALKDKMGKYINISFRREINTLGRGQDCVTIVRKKPMKYYK
eukprot:56270_1